MPDWVREALEESESEDWLLGALRMFSEVSMDFHLGKTPREVGRMRWWDVLSMRMVLRSFKADAEGRAVEWQTS